MADESLVQHDTDPPETEPSLLDERIAYSLTPTWYGVPLTAELAEAIELVDAALIVARSERTATDFADLARAARALGADA